MWPHILSGVAVAALATSVSAQQTPVGPGRTKSGPVTQITIEGKRLAGDDVLVRKGTPYVSVPALARALGASVASQGQMTVLSIPATSESGCGDTPDARRLSDAYRKAAVRIPDEVESLRAVVIPAASFDEVERQISEAEFRAQTDADKSVSYALSHATARSPSCTSSCAAAFRPRMPSRTSSIRSCAPWRASSRCKWDGCQAKRAAACCRRRKRQATSNSKAGPSTRTEVVSELM